MDRRLICALLALVLSACGGGNISVQQTQSPLLSDVVAFMGDSITHQWDLTQYDAGPTINFGVGGDTTVQMLARFDAVISAAPGVVVILGGTNDLFYNQDASTDSIAAMAAMAKASGIRVILCSVMPADRTPLAAIEIFNAQLIKLAQANSYLYADYYDEFLTADGTANNSLLYDGLHPNAAGYAVMWGVISPLLTEDLN